MRYDTVVLMITNVLGYISIRNNCTHRNVSTALVLLQLSSYPLYYIAPSDESY